MIKLSFHGAAETVTGSKTLLEVDGTRLLVDCGLFQGYKELRQRNWQATAFDPKSIDAVVLTHSHLDHVGYLPRLVKCGFNGPIFCSPACRELSELILLDAAKNQERDAEHAARKGYSKHARPMPLFDTRDAEEAIRLLVAAPRGEFHPTRGPMSVRFHNAGHLLGSNHVEVDVQREGRNPIRFLFSGDVGRYDTPLYFDPATPPRCDYLICESTYGDRLHPDMDALQDLENIMLRSIDRGGVVLVSSFAVGRAQQLIYLMRVLEEAGKIPRIPIYLDSPMAVRATNIYCRHTEDHDLTEGDLGGVSCVLNGPMVHLTRSVEESQALNGVKGPAIIISSAGMMTGGRILFHLKRRLPDAKNTVLLGGFMVPGTRGHLLQEGAQWIKIHGRDVRVRAHVESLASMSGHADYRELLRWLEPMAPPQKVFINHGEAASAASFAERLHTERGWDTVVPKHQEEFILEKD